MFEAEPLVEIAIDLPSASFIVLTGEIGHHVIELLVGAGERGANAAQRRTLEESAEQRVGAEPDADVDAVGDHRLQRLGAALGVEQFQRQAVLLEDALVLAEVGDGLLPAAALADGDLEVVVGPRASGDKH